LQGGEGKGALRYWGGICLKIWSPPARKGGSARTEISGEHIRSAKKLLVWEEGGEKGINFKAGLVHRELRGVSMAKDIRSKKEGKGFSESTTGCGGGDGFFKAAMRKASTNRRKSNSVQVG